MAVIQQRAQSVAPNNSVADWDGFLHSLVWPAGLSKRDRYLLYRRGKKDARHGLVGINEYGEIASPYCESLVRAANQRIALEWANCNSHSFDAQVRLDQIEQKIEDLNRRLKDATIRRDEALDAIRNRHYDGDDAVSEHLSRRRQKNREKPILDRFENENRMLNDELARTELEVIPHRYTLQKAEETARSHEQLIRADYLWRLSIYAYGASNYMKITPDMVNDSALNSESHERHKEIFNTTGGKHAASTAETKDDQNVSDQ